jgi:ADP-heptose:LPS heptosyltransferase
MSPAAQKLYAFALARSFDWIRLKQRRPLALFFRDGGIGDILCTLPTAAVLADRHPEAYKIYCTNPAFVSVPATIGRFDRVLGIKCNDLVARAARRHTVYRFRYPDEEPAGSSSAYLADEFATSFGLPPDLPWPKLDLGAPSPKVNALFAGRETVPTVCIHTGPTWAVREWPLPAWDELVEKLRARFGCRVLHIGASRHFREGERKEPPARGAEDCRDVFSIVESFQIIRRSRLVVGIDSGMIHGAVALGTPVIGVFGATSWRLRLPARANAVGLSAAVPCLACHHRHPRLHWQAGCPHDIRCMRELSPVEVFAEAARLLA